uniref:Uncharacterized protein n=1 Tax=Candidatus Kentrum sp. FM TaxID=2126340 RepID=A0A450TH34_9GAMM|nr:MAG: hypothetical protein BECKFM1743C_GA0114222_104275 [Candidatus Kentron sp. FM]VFJ68365.1 MAG: hypothetical protein BECKFM1743A_GA0114220_104716 [Candidatus Kentron sp. FM]VFK17218.1 MAG: hypothetical protein BECKFM1743B_GA0114221_104675 [Candidatus Kentron sp. FM]
MIEDPVVEEIRKYRAEHAARYGNDLKKICEALRKQEKESPKEFVDFGPKLLQIKQYGSQQSTMRSLE